MQRAHRLDRNPPLHGTHPLQVIRLGRDENKKCALTSVGHSLWLIPHTVPERERKRSGRLNLSGPVKDAYLVTRLEAVCVASPQTPGSIPCYHVGLVSTDFSWPASGLA